MKKIIAILLAVMLCAVALGGCKSDPVTADLVNYINNSMLGMIKDNTAVAKQFNDASTDSAATTDTVAAALQDTIIPANDALLAKAKAVKIETPEVKALNDKFIAAVEERGTVYETILSDMQANDPDAAATATEQLNSIDDQFGQIATDLNALKKAHNVVSKAT